MADPRNQILRLERFADELVGLYSERLLCHRAVHDARHQDDRYTSELWMLLDVLTDFVSVFIGHDDVANNNVGDVGIHHADRTGSIVTGDDVDILSPEGDLNDFAHGGAIVDEINHWRGGHQKPPSGAP